MTKSADIPPRRAKVLIVGGGVIGTALFDALNMARRFDITILDANPGSPWEDTDYFIHADDFFDQPQKYLEGKNYRYVVMAVPVYEGDIVERVVHACNATGVNYIDFSEDEAARNQLTKVFGGNADAFIAPGCGLAPGIIQIAANSMAQELDEVDDISMYVGNLPMSTNNVLRYQPMWSVEGVINEYVSVPTFIDKGKPTTGAPMGGYQLLTVNGTQYEAFDTSGGIGTMMAQWNGKADNVRYRTIRYIGHCKEVQRLLYKYPGRMEGDGPNTTRLKYALDRAKPLYPVEDVVLMYVNVTGKYKGTRVVHAKTWEIKGKGNRSAIQRATAGGAAMVMLAHILGTTKQTGVFQQEELNFAHFYTKPFVHLSTWAGFYE